jgi:hypothetical protein
MLASVGETIEMYLVFWSHLLTVRSLLLYAFHHTHVTEKHKVCFMLCISQPFSQLVIRRDDAAVSVL